MIDESALSAIIPVIHSDRQLLVVDKPARVDLEASSGPDEPPLIEILAALTEDEEADPLGDGAVLPLVVPEWDASGVAVYARSEAAHARVAEMALGGKVTFSHLAVGKGGAKNKKTKVGPKSTGGSKRNPKGPKAPAANAVVEIVRSQGECHIARCRTNTAKLQEVRRAFKSAGLQIEGDVPPWKAELPSKQKPNRRLMVHLEQIAMANPFGPGEFHWSSPRPESFQTFLLHRRPLEDHLHAALAKRLDLLLSPDTNCQRLFTGKPEGIGGLVVDRFDDVLIIEELEGQFQGDEQLVRQLAGWYDKRLKPRAIYFKSFPTTRSKSTSGPDAGQDLILCLKGHGVDELTVLENDLRYVIRPGERLSPGLFLDHRENRERVSRLVEGGKMLNLFSYTCGFSVVAAASGAITTSVDLSGVNLDWGRRNFEVNGLNPHDHHFVKDDVVEFVRRAAKKDWQYDMIVVDPPSFSRSKKPKRVFQVKQDLANLLATVLGVLAPGGHILVATNYRQVTKRWLAEQVEQAAQQAGRNVRIVARPGLPEDFEADPAFQKTVIARAR